MGVVLQDKTESDCCASLVYRRGENWFGTLRAVLALDCSTPVLYHIFKELHGVHDVFVLESRKKQL